MSLNDFRTQSRFSSVWVPGVKEDGDWGTGDCGAATLDFTATGGADLAVGDLGSLELKVTALRESKGDVGVVGVLGDDTDEDGHLGWFE